MFSCLMACLIIIQIVYHFMPTGCDRCPAGGYHGNGQCNSENHTSLFLRKVATLQWQVTSFLPVCMLSVNVQLTCLLKKQVQRVKKKNGGQIMLLDMYWGGFRCGEKKNPEIILERPKCSMRTCINIKCPSHLL